MAGSGVSTKAKFSGVHPKVAQSLMRHSDINLTMSRYTHVLRGQESKAVEALPDLSLPSAGRQKQIATGTDGENVLAFCLASQDGKQRTSVDDDGQTIPNSGDESAVLNGRCRNRTCDPLIKSHLLYRLS